MEFLDPLEALNELPHPLVIITAGDVGNKRLRSGMTAAWVSRVSWEPPLVAVAIAPNRYTLELIRMFREFAVNVVSKRLERVALEVFGTLSGRDVDKFELSKVNFVKGRSINAPVITDSPVVIECKLVKEVEAGDHIITIGEVANAYKLSGETPSTYYRDSVVELRV